VRIAEERQAAGLATLYLAELPGEPPRRVEFVDTREPGLPKAAKWVMMISTQAGCAVGCRMCDAAAAGYQGNLSAAEMLDQVRFMARRNPDLDLLRHPKVKIHFARMGEPSLNPAVIEALRGLAREFPGPGIIASVSSVAPKSPVTAAWFAELLRVKDECFGGGRFQLQFSLHSVDEEKRQEIVPIKKWRLEEVADFGRRFVKPGDRKVTINFAPGPGEALEPGAIARAFDPRHFLIKVTPVNPTLAAQRSGTAFVWDEAPPPLRAAAAELERSGFQVILSPSSPEEVESETSCGQLWSERLKASAAAGLRAQKRELDCYVTIDSMPLKAEAWLREASPRRCPAPPFDPAAAALLVVDMQDFFLDRSAPAYLPSGRAALRNVRRLVEAFRAAGRPVLFTLHAHEDLARDGGLMARWWKDACLAGSPWARVAAVLEPRAGDTYLKTRYSAFSNPALEARLKTDRVTQLALAGVKTDLCVESTARAAFDLGWDTFVAVDATAARTEAQHIGALKSLGRGFSALTDTGRLVAGVGQGGKRYTIGIE